MMEENVLIKAMDAYQLETFKEALGILKQQNNIESEQQKALVERSIRTKALNFGGNVSNAAEVEAFIKFVIELAKQEICSKIITIQVLQDIFDVSSTSRCEQLFEIVENNIDTWKAPFFFDNCKNQILRMCNDLLKRLSRTVNTTFCGRILILLAKSLPFNEKSGLNLTGQFNTQNVTTFEREKKEQLDESQPPLTTADDDMEMGEIRDHGEANGAIPVDHSLYVRFWDLQKYFSNPNLLFEPNSYNNFNEVLSEVLGIFSTYKLEASRLQQEHSPSVAPSKSRMLYKMAPVSNRSAMTKSCRFLEASAAAVKRHNVVLKKEPADVEDTKTTSQNCAIGGAINGLVEKMEVDDECKLDIPTTSTRSNAGQTTEHHFFAKYLTSQKLFPLQLADSQFRRYFLLQYLVVANYFLLKVKLKETFVLTPTQEEEIRELADKCFALLRETYPHGSMFAEAVKKVLSRERFWSSWKNEGCPDLITPLLNSPNTKCAVFKRKAPSRFVPGQLDLGNKELTRLWNIQSNNLMACKEAKRKNKPNMKQFIEEALDEMDPEQQVEEQYQSVNEEKYQWMASRFMLFTSDQYVSCTVQDARQPLTTSAFLKRTIQMTAESMPELKERSEQIHAVIKKKENAERARLAAEAKELEKLEKKAKQHEEDEQRKKEKKEEGTVATTTANNGTAPTSEQHIKEKEKEHRMEEKEKGMEKGGGGHHGGGGGGHGQRPTTPKRKEESRAPRREAPPSEGGSEKEEEGGKPKKRAKQMEEEQPRESRKAKEAEGAGGMMEQDRGMKKTGTDDVGGKKKEEDGGGGGERRNRKRPASEKVSEERKPQVISTGGGGGQKSSTSSSSSRRTSSDQPDRLKKRK